LTFDVATFEKLNCVDSERLVHSSVCFRFFDIRQIKKTFQFWLHHMSRHIEMLSSQKLLAKFISQQEFYDKNENKQKLNKCFFCEYLQFFFSFWKLNICFVVWNVNLFEYVTYMTDICRGPFGVFQLDKSWKIVDNSILRH
jgi:hypothetical protein